MELRDLDLNQLVLFHHLMVERRVSKVAEVLGLTQPAVSNALAKLRKQFGDDLFVRTPGGMVPTPFAEQFAEPIGYALSMIHSGINQRTQFDPKAQKRAMTIGMTDIGEIVFLPRLIERLSREAPGITLNTVRNTAVNLRDDMEAGRVDLAVGLLPQLKAGFFQRRLFRQRYVCLFRRKHGLDKKKLTLNDFKSAEHLVIVSAGTGHGKVDELIRKAGVQRLVRLAVPHFVSVGHILKESNLVATVPERLAQQLGGPFGLTYLPHPVTLPDIAINVFWHAQAHRSPANQWLRGIMCDLFGDDASAADAAADASA